MVDIFAPCWSLQNVLGCNSGHTEDHRKLSVVFNRARCSLRWQYERVCWLISFKVYTGFFDHVHVLYHCVYEYMY